MPGPRCLRSMAAGTSDRGWLVPGFVGDVVPGDRAVGLEAPRFSPNSRSPRLLHIFHTVPDLSTAPTPQAAPRPDLADPATLAAIGGIELVARAVVHGFFLGLHRSPKRGFSAEFAESRQYRPGDDPRYLDWRMFGRTDRYYVKQFQEETNLRAEIVVDASASMQWSSEPGRLPDKLWYAKHLGACISLILLRQGDSVGSVAFNDGVVARIRARGGRRQWRELTVGLAALDGRGGSEADGALREVAGRLTKSGLVMLISDLLVDGEETVNALRFLRHRGHEVIVFHLIDPGERDLPTSSEARFKDPETGAENLVNVADLRLEYRAAVREAVAEWEKALGPFGIDYHLVGTEEPLSNALRAALGKRERLA